MRASSTTVKSLKNIFLRIPRDRPAGVADKQRNFTSLVLRRNSHTTAGAIVFARVLQDVLHNQTGVTPFTRNVQFRWKTFLNRHIGRIGKRAKVIEPFLDKLAQ